MLGAFSGQKKFQEWYESLPAAEKVEALQSELPPQVMAAIKMFGNRGYVEGYCKGLEDIIAETIERLETHGIAYVNTLRDVLASIRSKK